MALPLKERVTMRISNPINEDGFEFPEGFFKEASGSEGFIFVSRTPDGQRVCYSSILSFGITGNENNPYIQFKSEGNYLTTERKSKIEYSWDNHTNVKEDSELLKSLGL